MYIHISLEAVILIGMFSLIIGTLITMASAIADGDRNITALQNEIKRLQESKKE